jgi:hypothetical protein
VRHQLSNTLVGLSKMLPVVVSSGISPPPSGRSGVSGTVGGPISSGEPWSWDGSGTSDSALGVVPRGDGVSVVPGGLVVGVAVTVAAGQSVAPGDGTWAAGSPVAPGVTVTVGVTQSVADFSGATL